MPNLGDCYICSSASVVGLKYQVSGQNYYETRCETCCEPLLLSDSKTVLNETWVSTDTEERVKSQLHATADKDTLLINGTEYSEHDFIDAIQKLG